MDFDNKTLAQYLVEVKRIEESRSKGADKEIRSLYKALLKNLNSFIGEYYTKYSNDEGILNVAILQQSAKYASFLEEVDKNIKEVTPAISKTIKSTVEKTYKACFEGMINGFSNSAGDSKFKDSFNGLSIKPEVLKAAVENPISGLTLPERLQKHRQDVIYDIRQSISNSLMTGERFDTTSKKLVERLDISYGKANRIVRTESHRVQEKGLLDGAEAIGDKVKDDGLIYAVIWRNMGDEKVRPNVRVHTSKGWKTYKSKTKANHIKMEGQVVEVGGYFDLGNGVKAKSPGESGTPENDCNCRCYLDYEMMTVDEFKERWGRWKNEGKVQQKPETEKAVGEKFASAGNDIGNISEKADKLFTNDDESGKIKEKVISGALNPSSERAQEHAEKYYQAVRKMKTDCKRIARNTGYSEDEIKQIKKFIFIDKHELGDGKFEQFAPIYEMAESWQRLIDGKNIQSHDLTLLKHEIMEKGLMKNGYSQDEAHTITSQKYNYAKEAYEYYDKIKANREK